MSTAVGRSDQALGRGLGRGGGALAGEFAEGGTEGDSATTGIEGGELVDVFVEVDGGAHGIIVHQFLK